MDNENGLDNFLKLLKDEEFIEFCCHFTYADIFLCHLVEIIKKGKDNEIFN